MVKEFKTALNKSKYLWLRSYKVNMMRKKIAQFQHGGLATVPHFIFGCQRSGTTILSDAINLCPVVWGYGEGEPPYFYQDKSGPHYLRLKSVKLISDLLQHEKSRYILLKPLYDSQYSETIVNAFPKSKGLWIYRNHIDVVDSHIKYYKKFDGASYIQGVFDMDKKNWQNEIILEESISTLEKYSNIKINSETGYALFWLVRNGLYFPVKNNKNFLIVNYEELVTRPEKELKKVFSFIGLPFHEKYSSIIHAKALNKKVNFTLDDQINRLCTNMMNRLNEAWEAQAEQRDFN